MSLGPSGNVTFIRRCLTDFPDWQNCQERLCKVYVTHKGTIEDNGIGCLQVQPRVDKFLLMLLGKPLFCRPILQTN